MHIWFDMYICTLSSLRLACFIMRLAAAAGRVSCMGPPKPGPPPPPPAPPPPSPPPPAQSAVSNLKTSTGSPWSAISVIPLLSPSSWRSTVASRPSSSPPTAPTTSLAVTSTLGSSPPDLTSYSPQSTLGDLQTLTPPGSDLVSTSLELSGRYATTPAMIFPTSTDAAAINLMPRTRDLAEDLHTAITSAESASPTVYLVPPADHDRGITWILVGSIAGLLVTLAVLTAVVVAVSLVCRHREKVSLLKKVVVNNPNYYVPGMPSVCMLCRGMGNS